MARDKAYGTAPIIVVYKTSKYSDAKTKIKKYTTKTIDELLEGDGNLPGVPKSAILLEIGVGDRLTNIWTKQYKIK